jgi:thiol-disulfide isomerase/thioredoxin
MNKLLLYVMVVILVLMAFISGYTGLFTAQPGNPGNVTGITTFADKGTEACKVDGKPVIYMFSTTWCSHCVWINSTFNRVAKEYMDAGKILAYHYEIDTGDNTLTPEIETAVPQADLDVYEQFNPNGGIPTFVFGCKYFRIGNGYEGTKDLAAEEAEFRGVIEALLK